MEDGNKEGGYAEWGKEGRTWKTGMRGEGMEDGDEEGQNGKWE